MRLLTADRVHCHTCKQFEIHEAEEKRIVTCSKMCSTGKPLQCITILLCPLASALVVTMHGQCDVGLDFSCKRMSTCECDAALRHALTVAGGPSYVSGMLRHCRLSVRMQSAHLSAYYDLLRK